MKVLLMKYIDKDDSLMSTSQLEVRASARSLLWAYVIGTQCVWMAAVESADHVAAGG